jgi:GntR family transcriptional regulator
MTNQTTSQRLHEALAQLISAAKPGEKLPSEPELARRLGVARATLREAMRTFETQGLIYRKQGAGTFVAHPSQVIETGLEVLESIETLAKRIGLPVTLGELRVEARPAAEAEAQALGIGIGQAVLQLTRVIRAEGNPVAFLIDILPEDVLKPGEIQPGFRGSVLDLLLQRGTPVLVSSRTEITAVGASSEVARPLNIQRGDVLLRFVAYLYTDSGRVVDYSYSYFLPGYFRFHVVRRVG